MPASRRIRPHRDRVFLSVTPAALMAFLLGPLLRGLEGFGADLALRLLFSALLLLAIWGHRPDPRWLRFGAACFVGLVLTMLGPAIGLISSDDAFLAGLTFSGTLAMLSLGVQLRALIHAQQVTPAHLSSAVFAYVLIGIVGGYLYLLIWAGTVDGSAFEGVPSRAQFLAEVAEHSDREPSLRGEVIDRLFYFSFVTLTTVGYGDITPLGRFAPNLATLQALLGQIFLTVLVAHLVSLNLVRRQRTEGDAGT